MARATADLPPVASRYGWWCPALSVAALSDSVLGQPSKLTLSAPSVVALDGTGSGGAAVSESSLCARAPHLAQHGLTFRGDDASPAHALEDVIPEED
eukprot:1161629-Pelagomonas_calceolata.AAC.5